MTDVCKCLYKWSFLGPEQHMASVYEINKGCDLLSIKY